jgi:hypothetical protein
MQAWTLYTIITKDNGSVSGSTAAAEASRREKMKKWNLFWVLLVVLIAAAFAPALFAAEPTGASPNDPLMVTGNWQTAAPNSALWFYFDYPGDKSKVQVSVDANGVGNLQLGVYTPEQAKQWLQDAATKPIGYGTPQNPASAASVHDLVWQGAFNMSGRFFAVVTNNNPTPVSFLLLVVGENVSLAPPPTATPLPSWMKNPYATPVPTGSIQGHLVFQESSGGNIYTVSGDGSNLKRITNGLDPAWMAPKSRSRGGIGPPGYMSPMPTARTNVKSLASTSSSRRSGVRTLRGSPLRCKKAASWMTGSCAFTERALTSRRTRIGRWAWSMSTQVS